MTIYDISLSISPNLPTWPGDPGLKLEQYESMDKGAHYNATLISSSVHLGTHVDAPRHFLSEGGTVEQLPLDVLTGPCYVTQLPDGIDAIAAEVLDRTEITSEMKRVLFGTSNSHYWAKGESKFQKDFVAITEDGAEWLVERGVQLVGVDYLSVAPYNESIPTHTVLLKAGVVIVEEQTTIYGCIRLACAGAPSETKILNGRQNKS